MSVSQRLMPTAAALAVAVRSGNHQQASGITRNLGNDDLRALAKALAKHVDLGSLLGETPHDPQAPIKDAVAAVAARFGVSAELVLSPDRHREVVDARMVACYVARLHGMTLMGIGAYLRKDHTTILNATVSVGERPRLRKIALEIAAETGWDRDAAEAS